MDPSAVQDILLVQLQTSNQYLLGILIFNGLVLLVMIASLIGAYQASQKASSRLDQAMNEWEPRLLAMEADWKELQAKLVERLDQSQASLVQMNALMDRTDNTLEELTPKLSRLASDAESLVHQVRQGVGEFQQSVLPKLKSVSNVAGALREGFGIFQQLRNNRSQDR